MEELMEFSKRLKFLRDEKNISTRELAEEIGISKTAINEYENAMSDPALTTAKKIADYFDEDIDWLIGSAPFYQRRIKKIAK